MSIEMPAAEVHALAGTLREAAARRRGDRRPARAAPGTWAARCSRRSRRSSTATGRPGARSPASSRWLGDDRRRGRRLVAGPRPRAARRRAAGWRRMSVACRTRCPLGMPPGDPERGRRPRPGRRRRRVPAGRARRRPVRPGRVRAPGWLGADASAAAAQLGARRRRSPRRRRRARSAAGRLRTHGDLLPRGPAGGGRPAGGAGRGLPGGVAAARRDREPAARRDDGLAGVGGRRRRARGGRGPPSSPARRSCSRSSPTTPRPPPGCWPAPAGRWAARGRPGDGGGSSPTWRRSCPAGATPS